jgi:hypothetical protein
MTRIVGLDCGRGSVHACVIDAPIENLKSYARSYKPLILHSNREDLDLLVSVGDCFGIEPTGADHRVFADYLKRAGKQVFYCKAERIRNHALRAGLTNKKDREDAAAIADYLWHSLNGNQINDPFINICGEELREAYNALKSIDRAKAPMSSQIWARLAYEFPEYLYTDSGKKRRFAQRTWGETQSPKPLRWLAGIEDYPKLEAQIEDSIGRGISAYTRSIAAQLCEIDSQRGAIELSINPIIDGLEPFYGRAFDHWNLAPSFKASFLTSIYPFEKFLGEDGRPIHERVPAVSENAKNDTTFRDRSLKRFMRQMGMGRVISESGTSKGQWVMGGSKQTRCTLYLFICNIQISTERTSKPRKLKTESEEQFKLKLKGWSKFSDWIRDLADEKHMPKVNPWENPEIIQAVCDRNSVIPAIADLQIYSYLAPNCQNVAQNQKIMKVGSRFTRQLYRKLLSEYKKDKS